VSILTASLPVQVDDSSPSDTGFGRSSSDPSIAGPAGAAAAHPGLRGPQLPATETPIQCTAMAMRSRDDVITRFILQGLRVLRPRILAFLGRSGAASEALVQHTALTMHSASTAGGAAAAYASAACAASGLLQWDAQRRAGVALPFDIGRLVFWLDPLLPQARAI